MENAPCKFGKKAWLIPMVALAASLIMASPLTTRSQDAPKVVAAPKILDERPMVGIAKGTDYPSVTSRAIELAGGLEGVVKKGDTVLIKPNVVGPSPSGAGRITDWRIVQEVVNQVRKLGAARVVVAEAPVDKPYKVCFEIAGYFNIKNAELMDLYVPKDECYYVTSAASLVGQPLYIPKIYLDADAVISVSILKTHSLAGVTMSLKNVGIGVPTGRAYGKGGRGKDGLHTYGINRSITDVNLIRRPDFNIIDGMVAGEGDGPVNPTPKPMNLVIAGKDPVAVDTVGTTIMGFDPYDITHLVYANSLNVGVMDMNRIRVAGEAVKPLISPFKKPPFNTFQYKATSVAKRIGKLTIDGNLGDWSEARQNRIGSDTMAVAYDDKYLYISARVKDGEVRRGSDGDGVDVFMSFGNYFDEAENKIRKTYKRSPKDQLVSIFAGDGEARVQGDGGKAIGGSEVKTVFDAQGYAIEAALPLAQLNAAGLKYGDQFYFDMAVRDAGKDKTSKRFWSGDEKSYTNILSLGRMLAL